MYHITSKNLHRLRCNESGLAMVEFAISLPFFAALTIGGVEIANYASLVMKLNQIALHTADNAARIGTLTANGDIQITEKHIKDVIDGAIREGSNIALEANARIFVSGFEEVDGFNATNPRYLIKWQRCGGDMTAYKSSYGDPATTTSVSGIGPTGRQVSPSPGGSLMFVELQYSYQPMIVNGFTRLTNHTIKPFASMVVRDRRDLTGAADNGGIYAVEGVDADRCVAPSTP